MNRPVVLQVLHTLQVGGAEVLAARLARGMRDRYEFVFACLDGLGLLGEQLREEGYSVEVLARKAGVDVSCVRQLACIAEHHQAHIIHAHQYTPFFYSRAPGWIGRRRPVLFTEHGRNHPDLPNQKRMLFNRLFLRKRDRVVAVGESVKKALIDNEGIPPDRIEVIYNGVRLEHFAGDNSLRRQVRFELGLNEDDPVAIQVARLDYLKDHSTALRTAALVRERRPDFKLLLVGDGPERQKIEREISDRQLENTVRLLGTRTDIRRLLTAADLFLLTSISEGIPVTLIEAAAAGIPVVSTDVGGIPEIIIPGKTGYTAPAKSEARLAEAVLQIFARPAEAQAIAEAAAHRAGGLFSEQKMHDAYARVYEQMLAPMLSRRLVLSEATC